MVDARHLLARDRMRRHEMRQLGSREGAPCRLDDVTLGRSDIHHQRAGFEAVADRQQGGFGGSHGHGQQDDVAPGDRGQRRRRRGIDDAELSRALGGAGRGAVTDDVADQLGAPQGHGERAADQTAADESQAFEPDDVFFGPERGAHVTGYAPSTL